MAWTAEDYFAKAQAYWERARSQGRDNHDFLLHVSFTVEFVARGSLCKVNPALNAASDVESLLFACGQDPRTPPKTVDLTEGLKRLQRLLPELTEAEMVKVRSLLESRNSELHGDRPAMSQLAAPSFMPSVYSFIVKVAEFAGQSVETILGKDDAELAKRTADAIAKDRSKRIKDLVRVCKERFFSMPDEEQRLKRESSRTTLASTVLTSGNHVMYLQCPACAQSGELLASPVGRSTTFVRDDQLVQEIRVVPLQFTCKCCGLEIRGLDELMAAGFDHEYCSTDDVDPLDHFKIDPRDYVDHEDIAREFFRHEQEYQDE